MTYQALRTALAACRTIDATNSSVTVCLASKTGKERPPSLHRLQMTDGLADGFRTLAVDTLRKLDTDLGKGDITLEAYNPGDPQASYEVEVHVPDPGSTPHVVVQALDDLPQLPVFDGAPKTINNLKFHVIAIQRTAGPDIYLFRKYSKSKELGRSKGLLAWFQNNTFNEITEPVFIFDNQIDAAWIDGHMVIFKKDNYHVLFQYFSEVLQHAQTTLNTIKAAIPIDNVAQFEQDCKGNALILMKLRSIAGRSYLPTLTLATLEGVITARNLPVAITGTGSARKIVYDPQHKWKFLRLLDDGFLSSGSTGLHYEVTGKRAL